jgi:hypothetical protein
MWKNVEEIWRIEMYFALDHSGGPKQYPVTIGCARIDNVKEAKQIIDDLRDYLKKKGAPFWNKPEIKWINLRIQERLWLSEKIRKSKLKFSGSVITSSYYEMIKNKFLGKVGFLPYKIFGLWYSLTLEILLNRKEMADVHIDRFLEDREGKPTKEMDVITDTLENILKLKRFSLAVGLYRSHSDIGVQIADYIAGIIADRKKLIKLSKKWAFPKNIKLKINPKIDKITEKLVLTGHATLGMNPVSLNNKQPLGFIKFTVFEFFNCLAKPIVDVRRC